MGVNVPAERSATSSQIEDAAVARSSSPWPWPRLALLLLLAFAHAVILLDAKDLWWDESLSLQRAEESLPNLVRGVLVIKDGLSEVPTIDQHPFFSFLLQGALIRLAGDSVFVLRYVSAMAAALFAASTWTWGRWLVRRELAAPSTAWWATLLAAISPFLLWYGQEARPYALWAALALLSTYLLVRATDGERLDIRFLAGFLAVEAAFALTHYYAVFLIALHGLMLAVYFVRRRMVAGLLLTAGLLLFGAAVGGYAAWTIFSQGGGQNFASISLRILVPDLVNAFSLGLSVDLAVVWPLDVLFGVTALAGAIWSLRSKAAWARSGWILPAALLLPVAIVLLLDRIQPLYMNARHLSLLVGPFLLLTGAGIALLYRWRSWAGALLALVFVTGIGYSTVNYHTQELYAKDDYTRLGEYMQGRIMPGDAVLYYPPSSWRIFEYYLPMAPV
ncbi:MAG: glycosyltransferase family 39 protein, partial [Caldilineaceae bacterium]|nr:glycosyltransferase family 39 protein [Caldilineaceae bacterium]